MLFTYNQTSSAEKNHVGGKFPQPKSTAISRRGSSEHTKPVNGTGSKEKVC